MDKRAVKDITRDEWVAYEWIDATALGDKDRMYVQGMTRKPEEAIQAGLDHDAIMAAINNLQSAKVIMPTKPQQPTSISTACEHCGAVLSINITLETVMPVLPTVAETEQRAIQHALEYTRGDKSAAARILGIGRKTLYRKLERYARAA